jgi:two-component system sensor histidine kinase PilS (NtrC family)
MTERKNNLVWLILARLVIVSLFLVTITYLNFRQPFFFTDEMLRGVTLLIIFTYCFSVLSLTTFRLPPKYVPAISYAQVIWEMLFCSILVVLTGGISSPYAFFYNLAIINASFLFARREAVYTAGLCGIIYGAIIDFHYFGRLNSFGLFPEVGDYYGSNHIVLLILTNLLAFFITAVLAGYLAERANRSETALRKKEIDYEELKQLNSLIVSTLDSGLITINQRGNIRVFNQTASEITGVAQIDAYDKPLENLLPELGPLSELLGKHNKDELIYTDRAGNCRILTITTAPFRDSDGNTTGAVIDIQDVTRIREMESQLKKTDRLAAIGELSARIAHEIRNPLASISGSVQLISQSDMVPEKDRKLLDIVQRETERLDCLLGDFLHYARPTPPTRCWFCPKSLIDELMQLLRVNKRFSGIEIHNKTPGGKEIYADRDQFRQVIWNLLLNAAEAITESGTVVLESRYTEPTPDDSGEKTLLEVSVSDNGSGISPHNMGMIFEPFFTTKNGGSGLGLAMVYRIIEAHGGNISVENVVPYGTCFRFRLPVACNTSERCKEE